MKLELYFAPGACSFVPHVGLECVRAATGQDFTPKLVKLHKGEHQAPEYLALNPNGQVPVLVVDGRALNQIVAVCDFIDRAFPQAALLPNGAWARAQALSQLAWMNNTAHTTFTHVFRPEKFADGEAAQAAVKDAGRKSFRECLERVQSWVEDAKRCWFGERPSFHDAYAFTLLRWGGYAGIDPSSLPQLKSFVERAMAAPPVAAALERERVKLDTFKPA
ncbi:MAG: glutathione S-transferase family protein [Betaproteobacteria bacterium]